MILFLFGFNRIVREPKNMPKKLLRKKISLDKLTKKQFQLLRLLIYFLDFFIVAGFTLFHALQPEIKTFKNLQTEQENDYATIQHFNRKDYSSINLSIKLTDEEFEKIDEKQIEVKVIKTLSPLLREKGNIIVKESDLREKLFEQNESSISNGNLVSSFFSTFYIEQGNLRKINDTEIKNLFKTLTFKTSRIKQADLKKFQLDEPLDFDNLKKDSKFPKNLILKADEKFYITETDTIHPIFSKKLIEGIWPNFSFVSANLPKEENMTKMECLKNNDSKELTCSVNLELLKDKKMNVYYFKIENIPLEKNIKLKLDFEENKTFLNYLIRLRKLFW